MIFIFYLSNFEIILNIWQFIEELEDFAAIFIRRVIAFDYEPGKKQI